VEHQLLCGEGYQRVGAGIARRSGAEDHWHEGREGARVGCRRPRDQVLNILALGRAKNGEEKRSGRLAAITGRGDNAQRPPPDPAAAAFVAERRTPTAAAHDLARRAPPVSDGSGADDQQNSRAVLERVVHRDESVGIDHDFFSELFGVERRVQCATLFVAAGAGDSAVEHARDYGSRLGDLGERPDH